MIRSRSASDGGGSIESTTCRHMATRLGIVIRRMASDAGLAIAARPSSPSESRLAK